MREQWVIVHWGTPEELPFYRAQGFALLPEGQPFGEVVGVGADGEEEVVLHHTMALRRPMLK